MPHDPRISVVMITRDRCAETVASARRIVALAENPRLIVVDNGSRDGTIAALRAGGLDLDVLALERNLAAAGRNVGVDYATTPYVAFSDDDSWWAPGALTRIADLFDAHPRLGLIQGCIRVGAEDRLDPTCGRMATSGLAGPGPGVPIVGFVACGAAVRRAAFVQCGGFDERFGVGGEETVLSLDLLRAGWAMRYVEDVVAHHHPSPVRDPAQRRTREVRNALWSSWLRRPLSTVAQDTLAALRGALRGHEHRRGLLLALAGAPWVLLHRRPIPASLERHIRAAGD